MTKHKNVALDELRILAALMVLGVHTGQKVGLGDAAAVGAQGVQLFFVLSGYLAAARYPLSTKNSCTPCAPTAAASPRPTFCPVCTPSTISAARIRSSSSATFLCFVIFLYSAPYCSII